jgi:hypothetical protein
VLSAKSFISKLEAVYVVFSHGTLTTNCHEPLTCIAYVLLAVQLTAFAATDCTVSLHNLTNHDVLELAALYVVSVAEIVFQSAAICILVQAIKASCFQFQVVLLAAVTNLFVEVESSTKSASS